MLLDARTLEDGTVLNVRTCVVGGGAAGVTVAMALADRGHDVLLLESGGLDGDADTQALYEAAMTGEQWGPEDAPTPVAATRLRLLGGTTNHWAGYCRPLRAVDYEVRPGLSRSGWDIPADELERWYPPATEVLGLRSRRFDPQHWHEETGHPLPLLRGDPEDNFTGAVFQLSPVNFGSTYRGALEDSDRITVALWANVTALRAGESGRGIDEVAVQTLEGTTATVVADVVVLAVGGIETPRLLLASNQRGGLANEHDLVGRTFCEHFQNTLAFAVVTPSPDDLAGHLRQTYAIGDGDATVQSALVVKDEVLREGGLLGMEAQLLPVPFPGDDVPVTLDGPSMADLAGLVPLTGDQPVRSVVLVQVNAEQELNPASRVTLGPDVDALGMPRADVHWAHTELDRRSILTNLQLLGRDLGRSELGRLQVVAGSARPGGDGAGLLSRFQIDPGRTDELDFHLAHGNHHMCTARLADDPTRGVVDRDARVHGIENLFLAGSAVFPTPGVAAPTITLVALALRLAAHLDQGVLR